MSAIENPLTEIAKKVFGAADLLYAFINPDGPQMDLAKSLSPEFDLKSELPGGRAKVLTKNRLSSAARFPNSEKYVLLLQLFREAIRREL